MHGDDRNSLLPSFLRRCSSKLEFIKLKPLAIYIQYNTLEREDDRSGVSIYIETHRSLINKLRIYIKFLSVNNFIFFVLRSPRSRSIWIFHSTSKILLTQLIKLWWDYNYIYT